MDDGSGRTAEELLPVVYDELRKLAAAKLAHEGPGQTLEATALVHEAYMRLLGGDGDSPRWDNHRHFFAAAAEAMRRILVDNARRKQSSKHGGDLRRQDLDEEEIVAPEVETVDLPSLDAALNRLAETEPQKARLVELRYFVGLTGDQAAKVLGISPSSADRQWIYARAWLRRELGFGART
jgi:RNA polymerase sigma factor (TIGR02999 family)